MKFPTNLVDQVRGSYLAKVESTKRISKYDILMQLVVVFEDLVPVWCNNLQVMKKFHLKEPAFVNEFQNTASRTCREDR